MNLTSEKFTKIVEELVEKLKPDHLNHMDVSTVLMAALEAQGFTIGADDAQGEEVTIPVVVDSDTYENLQTVVKNCNLADTDSEGMTSHGQLDIPGLLAMLAQDAAMTNSRPGSWEGSNMQQVLDSHGYH